MNTSSGPEGGAGEPVDPPARQSSAKPADPPAALAGAAGAKKPAASARKPAAAAGKPAVKAGAAKAGASTAAAAKTSAVKSGAVKSGAAKSGAAKSDTAKTVARPAGAGKALTGDAAPKAAAAPSAAAATAVAAPSSTGATSGGTRTPRAAPAERPARPRVRAATPPPAKTLTAAEPIEAEPDLRATVAAAAGAAGPDTASPVETPAAGNPSAVAAPAAERVDESDVDTVDDIPAAEASVVAAPADPAPDVSPPLETAEPAVRPEPDPPAAATHPDSVAAAAADLAPPRPSRFDEVVLRIAGLTKRFGGTIAADGISLDVHAGSFFGIVGPNGAGKTTTLSMVTGLLRPDAGTVLVHGIDVWAEPERAKRAIGVLPDALRLFDRLTGAQLLFYSGALRGLDRATVQARSADLVAAFGLEDATGRLVADYSAGMTKKIALAAAMIHSPRLLVLDEPFESVDPVSAANIIEILQHYVAAGGTVVLSSHGMDLIQRVCDHVAIVVGGRVLAAGTTDDVRGDMSLEDRFVELAGGRKAAEGMEWLHSFSD